MTIRDIAARCETKICEIPRIEWALALRSVPMQADKLLEQMRLDLLMGANNAGTDTVGCQKEQVIAMCDLMPQVNPPEPQKTEDTP